MAVSAASVDFGALSGRRLTVTEQAAVVAGEEKESIFGAATLCFAEG